LKELSGFNLPTRSIRKRGRRVPFGHIAATGSPGVVWQAELMRTANQITILGDAHSRRGRFPFGIRQTDRLQHLHIIGQTGTGKSTLMRNLIIQDIEGGRGLCLLDPHGDLARQIAETFPDRCLYWDVADQSSPYGYNPITPTSAAFRPLVASGLIDALKKQWIDAWGARMEHLLRFAVLALLEQPRADLRDIMHLFLDSDFRKEVVERITDPQVLEFWTVEFPKMNYKTAADGVAPIANKVGAFLAHPIVRKSVCDPEQPLRFRRIMDEGQVLIVNLSKGRLGTDTSNVLGGLILSSVVNAAYSRQSQPEHHRRSFFLYADEFQAFSTSAFASALSELRKYGLGIILAHQHAAQLDPLILEAVFGNVGSMISFRIGATDAPLVASQLGDVLPSDLVRLPNYEAQVRLMVDGEKTASFTMFTHAEGRAGEHHSP